MNDKFVNGFLSGTIGAIVMIIINLIANYFNLVKDRFHDFTAVLLWGRIAKSLGETITASFSHIFFTALLGILFSYLTPYINKRYYLFKGWVYGTTIWFSIYTITTLLKLPNVGEHTLSGSLTNGVSSSIYGIILAFSLSWLDSKNEASNSQQIKVKPAQHRFVPVPVKKLTKDRKVRLVKPVKIR